jgi:hypothetical protein
MDNRDMGPETVKIRRAGTEDLPGIMRLQLLILEPGEAAEFSCRVPHWLGAVDGPAEALAIFGPQGERSPHPLI